MDCSDVPLMFLSPILKVSPIIFPSYKKHFPLFFFSFVSLQSEQTYCFKVGNDVFRGSQSLPQT